MTTGLYLSAIVLLGICLIKAMQLATYWRDKYEQLNKTYGELYSDHRRILNSIPKRDKNGRYE